MLLSSGHEHNLNAMSERHIASVEALLRGNSWDPSRWLSKVKLAEFAINANPLVAQEELIYWCAAALHRRTLTMPRS